MASRMNVSEILIKSSGVLLQFRIERAILNVIMLLCEEVSVAVMCDFISGSFKLLSWFGSWLDGDGLSPNEDISDCNKARGEYQPGV